MAERIDILVAARNQASPVAQQVAGDFRAMSQQIQGMGQSGSSAIDGIAGSLGGLGSALAGGAIVAGLRQIGEELIELGRRGAVFDQLGDVLDTFAASVGSSSDAFVAAGQRAAQGTISSYDLILNANRAIQFEVAQTAEQYAQLIELATALGRAQGISDTQALDFITTGIARESRLILDNLGLIIDLDEATAKYAETLGKTGDQLTQAERKQALLAEAYKQGSTAIQANKDAVNSAATQFERFDAGIQNLRDTFGAWIADNSAGYIKLLADDLERLNDVLNTTDTEAAQNKMNALGQSIVTTAEKIQNLQDTKISLDAVGNVGGSDEATQKIERLRAQIVSLGEDYNEAAQKTKAPLLDVAGLQAGIVGFETAEQAAKRLAAAAADALQKQGNAPLLAALEGAPELVREVARSLEDLGNTPIPVLTEQVKNLSGTFEDLEKAQKSIQSGITGGSVKLVDIIGDDRAFALATQQIEEFDAKLKELTSQALTGELDPGEFLFKLQTLPSQATEIFGQVTAAAKDGGEKLRAELANLVNLEDVFRSGGNTAGADLLAGQIRELQSVLAIVAPAAQNAATGLGALGNAAVTADSQLASIVTNAGGAGSAAVSLGASAGNAANEVYVLNAALAGAPPALAAAGAAMIAAGSDALTTAAAVGRLRDEFNALSGAQAGARRAIIQRAAGVADIVGPQKALALANQEIAKSEAAYKGLESGLLAAGDGSLQFEFDLALLGTTTTSTFDEIEEADRKAKQLATQGLKSASAAASDTGQAFDSLKGKVAGVLSGALNLDVGVDTESILGREDAINEDARRLADVAVKGFDSPWAQYLADKFPDTIGAAFDGADPKKAAAQLLRDFEDGLRPELLDKERAKERVRRALVGEQNMAALAQEIAAELSAEFGGSINLGRIQAVAGTTLGVDGAETDQLARTLSGAASGVQQQLAGLGGSVKSGILAALEGIGDAVTGALDKQFRSEGNLKTMREAGGTNGEAWGSGFLAKVGDNVPPKLVEILASLVTPSVEALLNRNASLQGAN